VSTTVRGWLLLLAAVLAVATALWVLQPRPRSHEREAGKDPSGAMGARGGTPERGPGGVAARETTISGAGWVRGQVVDTDGAAVEEGRLVLWCLGNDGRVARIEGGVLELDEEGRFSGPACRGELVCPELRHPALVPAEPWSLRPGTEGTLEARPLPRLWGRVVDPGGTPVVGAMVGFSEAPDEDDPTAVLPVVASQTSSDADGEFSVARVERPPCDPCQTARQACPEESLPVADRVLVTVRAPGWAPGSRVVELGAMDDADTPVDVALRPATASITGTLVDAQGHALPRAVVLARSQSQPHEQHRAEASDGTFSLPGLAEGPYAVRAIQDGRELLRHEGVVPGASLALELPTALHDVELELVDEEGRPRPGVEVDGGPFSRQRTDADGRLRAERVAPGPYILRIRLPTGPSGPAGPIGGKPRAYDLEVPAEAEISQPLRLIVVGEATEG
jgi:hypothetical protein